MADVLMERNGVRADVAETSVATMEGWGWAVVAPPAPEAKSVERPADAVTFNQIIDSDGRPRLRRVKGSR